MQGVVLGGYLQGIDVKDEPFAGGTFDWLAPFPLFTGLALRRRLRAARRDLARHEDRGRARRMTRAAGRKTLLLAVLVIMAIISLWTPLAFERIAERWFTWPNISTCRRCRC